MKFFFTILLCMASMHCKASIMNHILLDYIKDGIETIVDVNDKMAKRPYDFTKFCDGYDYPQSRNTYKYENNPGYKYENNLYFLCDILYNESRHDKEMEDYYMTRDAIKKILPGVQIEISGDKSSQGYHACMYISREWTYSGDGSDYFIKRLIVY